MVCVLLANLKILSYPAVRGCNAGLQQLRHSVSSSESGHDHRNSRLSWVAVSNVLMSMFGWRRTLPVLQMTIALVALVYAPYELRARYHVVGDDFMLLGYRSVFPPPMLRFTYAMNFPAVAAAYSVQFASWAPREAVHYQGPPMVSLSLQNCVFLVSVGALWYLIGGILDRRKRGLEETRSSKSSALAPLVLGFMFSVGVDALASFFAMLTNADRPMRQIGFFGIAWALVLLYYFGSNLIAALRLRRAL